MKRVWFRNLAIAMGLLGASPALAQYPAYNMNTGPSSYPLQLGGSHQLTNWQETVPSVPASPYASDLSPAGQHQPGQPLLGQHALAQPHVGHVPSGQAPMGQVAPLPIVPQYSPANPSPPVTYSQPGPIASYQQQQSVAPGCTTCGTAPVSQGYLHQNYGPAPYAFSAPSIGYDGGCGCGPGYAPVRGRHLGYGHLGHGLPVGAKPFFFGGGVLIFKRIDDYNRLLSVSDATGAGILHTADAQMRTMGGFEVMGGRYFNCGKNAIAASYWGLFPETQTVDRTDAGGGYRAWIFRPWVGPANNTGEFQMPAGAVPDPVNDLDVYNLYDMATTHRLTRSSSFHNIEINLLGFGVGCAARNFNRATAGTLFSGHRHGLHAGYGGCGAGAGGPGVGGGYCGPGACGDCGNYGCGGECGADASRYATGPCGYVAPACGSRLNLSWLAGIRYLQFNDDLHYSAMGGLLGANVLNYDVAARNHLVGFQIGGRADYCVGTCANLYSLAKAGIYGNHASLDSRLGSPALTAYRSNDPTMPYNINRSKDQLAFLSEIGAGVGYRFSPKWTATCGYRAIVASGVATAVGNVRHQGQGVASTGINAQDYLVLHGLNIGALYNF